MDILWNQKNVTRSASLQCYAMFLAKQALHFNDEEFSEQLSQFSKTDALLKLETFRLKYKDNYEYKFSILNTYFRFGGQNISKCTCSELKTYTCSCLRTPVWWSQLLRIGWSNQPVKTNYKHSRFCVSIYCRRRLATSAKSFWKCPSFLAWREV